MATIQLTDGTTTLNLFDESSYSLIDQSWSPAVATRRRDGLGGPPYNYVVESLALRIKGSSTTDCLGKLHNLTALLDQADRWRMGEDVAAVLFKYKPTGSAANVLSATVMGAPENGPMVIVPGRVEWIEENNYQLFPVLVSFVRLGVWLDDEESDASGSVANPGIMTATNTATDLPSPVRLLLTDFCDVFWGGSFLLITDDADKLDIFSMATETTTGFTAVSDTDQFPYSGGNILRYTPTTTNWAYTDRVDIASLLLPTTRHIAVFANFRRNAAGTEAQAKVRVQPAVHNDPPLSPDFNDLETQPIVLTETGPQWYYLGEIVLPVDMYTSSSKSNYLYIGLKTNNTSSTVDLDAVALMDAENSTVLFMPGNTVSDRYSDDIAIDHRLLTHITPAIVTDSLGFQMPGARIVTAQAAEVAAMWLASGYGSGRCWAAVNSSQTAKLSNALTAIRRPAYLVPQ